jgi:hypothetical protein
MEELIAKITKKVIAVSGENMFVGSFCSKHRQNIDEGCQSCRGVRFRDVNLEDILKATGDKTSVVGSKFNGCFLTFKTRPHGMNGYWTNEENILWNFGKPLEDQRIETLVFIDSLLSN